MTKYKHYKYKKKSFMTLQTPRTYEHIRPSWTLFRKLEEIKEGIKHKKRDQRLPEIKTKACRS